MNNEQKAAIYHHAMFHYLHNEDFHLDIGDVEAAIQSDSVEDVNQAYALINQENFQNKVKRWSADIRSDIQDAAVYYSQEVDEPESEDDPYEGFPYNGHGGMPDSPMAQNGRDNGNGNLA